MAPYGSDAARRAARDEAGAGMAVGREPRTVHDSWLTAHPGNPLGHGMPLGAPLREDGETHREAWMRLVRADPCSYCGRAGGTVDHIDPQSGPRVSGGLHSWLNYTAACERCNGAKRNTSLFLWLARRPVLGVESDQSRPERKAA